MNFVVVEAKYIYSIYIYIYVPWVPWDVKTGFPPAARIRRVCEYATSARFIEKRGGSRGAPVSFGRSQGPVDHLSETKAKKGDISLDGL